jgi:hypothetical protein
VQAIASAGKLQINKLTTTILCLSIFMCFSSGILSEKNEQVCERTDIVHYMEGNQIL